ncbi:MAG TPA: hypothetical protein VEB19_17380 [Gemmatimonadaceae bacterium]|nr:hypothetical protein [Gemmatimonadaceae bacterium]
MRRILLAAALSLLASACAGRRIARENATALAAADARVLQGCYDCLLEARATYARLAASQHFPRDTALVRLFETQLLLGLREKELQLNWTPSIDSARMLAPHLPPGFDAPRLLAIVDAVFPDGTGRMPGWPEPLRRRVAPYIARVSEDVAWLHAAPLRQSVREYLALALDCSHDGKVLAPQRPPGAPHRRPILQPGASPLVMYRTAICLGQDTIMLQATRAHVPEFPEAAYFIANSASFFAEENGGVDAARLYAEARSRFPQSPSVQYMSGWLASNVNECDAALRFFDATVSIDSTHEMAWLQRTICLSSLKRDSAAIASATHVIALGTGFAGQGYYWRAVSHHRLRNLDAARADIEVAKRQARSPSSLTVAGVIEHDQGDLPVAEQDLLAARAELRGDENCTAAWYLGLVYAKQQRAPDAAGAFEAAMRCYDIKVADARYRIAHLQARPTRYPEVRAKRIASIVADTVDNRSRYFASAFNAAGHVANSGDLSRALRLVDVAASDPKLAEPVARLRAAIAAVR